MGTLVILHGAMRWLVLAAGVVGLVLALLPPGGAGAGPRSRITGLVFMAALDVQLLLGLILMALAGRSRPALPHGIVMLLAVAAAHVLRARLRKAGATAPRWQPAIVYAAPLVLVLVGLLLRPQGIR